MTELRRTIDDIVPNLYDSVASDFQYPPGVNLAGSNQCHVLSKGLWLALDARGIRSRRELHQDDEGLWHYVVAHTPLDAQPSEDDIVTDLNPWQFMDRPPLHYTYLHESRQDLMDRLASEGAPDYFVALRGLATVVMPHTDSLKIPR